MDYELLLMLLCPSKREARSSSTHQRCPEPLKVCETVLHRAVAFTLENPFLLLSYNDHTSRHKHWLVFQLKPVIIYSFCVMIIV